MQFFKGKLEPYSTSLGSKVFIYGIMGMNLRPVKILTLVYMLAILFLFVSLRVLLIMF